MEDRGILKAHIAKLTILTDEQFDYFFSHFKKKSFQKGQAIITEGDQVDCEYFVISGCLKSFYINDDLKMFILQCKKIISNTECRIMNFEVKFRRSVFRIHYSILIIFYLICGTEKRLLTNFSHLR
jgi:CRP-like cAMP-binding protein